MLCGREAFKKIKHRQDQEAYEDWKRIKFLLNRKPKHKGSASTSSDVAMRREDAVCSLNGSASISEGLPDKVSASSAIGATVFSLDKVIPGKLPTVKAVRAEFIKASVRRKKKCFPPVNSGNKGYGLSGSFYSDWGGP